MQNHSLHRQLRHVRTVLSRGLALRGGEERGGAAVHHPIRNSGDLRRSRGRQHRDELQLREEVRREVREGGRICFRSHAKIATYPAAERACHAAI